MPYDPLAAADGFSAGLGDVASKGYEAWHDAQPVSDAVNERLQAPNASMQKWIDHVSAGTMSPQEAATRARLEAMGHPGAYNGMNLGQDTGGFVAPQMSGADSLYARGSLGAPQLQAPSIGGTDPRTAATQMQVQQPQQSPSLGAPVPQQLHRLTYGDLKVLQQSGNLLRQHEPTDTPEARMMRELIKERAGQARAETKVGGSVEAANIGANAQRDVANTNTAGKKDVAATQQEGALQREKLKFTTAHDKLANDLQIAAMKLKTAISVAQLRGGSSEAIAAMKAVLGEAGRLEAQSVKLSTSLTGDLIKDPDTIARITAVHQQLVAMEPLKQQAEEVAKQKMGAKPSTTESTRATVTQPAQAAITASQSAATAGQNARLPSVTRTPTSADLNAMMKGVKAQ